jgi:hypothetical protein
MNTIQKTKPKRRMPFDKEGFILVAKEVQKIVAKEHAQQNAK